MALTDDRTPPPGAGEGGNGFDRQPPQDLTAEQSVLGGMMLSKDAIADVVEVLRPGDFYRPAHQLVYDCILDLYSRGEPADAVTVAAELDRRGEIRRVGGAPYLHTLIAAVPTAANASYYAEIVAEKATLRRLVEAGTRIVQMGYSGAEGADINEIVDRAQSSIYEVTERRMSEDYVALEELLQPTMDEIDAIASRGGTSLGVPTGFADFEAVTNGLHPGQMIIIAARPGIGKALALDTPLPTPTGWTTMGEIAVGDRLLGADGRPTTVVATTDVMNDRPCYEVEFSDGTVVVADAEHQWKVTTRARRRQLDNKASLYWDAAAIARVRTAYERSLTQPDEPIGSKDAVALIGDEFRNTLHRTVTKVWRGTKAPRPFSGSRRKGVRPTPVFAKREFLKEIHDWITRPKNSATTSAHGDIATTEQIRAQLRCPDGRLNYAVSNSAPLALPEADLLIPPYALGAWLGDGASAAPRITTVDCGSSDLRGLGRRCGVCHDRCGTFTACLRTLGVLGNKHIPPAYLRSSERQRRALLAGLLDTDGTVGSAGGISFGVVNKRLAEDVYELVVSLGYRCSINTKHVQGRNNESSTYYQLNFSTDDDVFRLDRKNLAHKQRRGASNTRRSDVRYIIDVRPVRAVPVRCVEVDAVDHLYLAGRSMVPTHNSTLGLDFARSCSITHRMTSVIFSLEMSRTEIVMRMLSAEAKIRLQDMRGGRMTDDDWTRLARRMSEVSEAPLFVDDSPNMTMMEIRAKARRLKQRHDLKLVVVDYMQLMTSGKRVESRQQEVSEFSRQLKLLAKEIEVPVIAISQLNRGPEQRTDKRPMLSDLRESGCLTRGTRVLRADTGTESTFGELLESGELPVVWSLDERLRMVARQVSKVFPSGVEEVFRLRLASGRELEATANHPFLTVDGWVPLGELAVGDRLAVPRRLPQPVAAKSMPEAELVLLAHLIGDGSFVKRQPIRCASIDEETLRAVTEAAEHFGTTAVRDEHPQARCTSLRLPAPFRLTHGKRNPIAAWLDEHGLFGLRSHEKFIPNCVSQLPTEQVALFIRHLWATDGSVRWDDEARQARIYYASTSRPLVDGLAQLLLRVGVLSRIKTVRKSGYRDGWHLYVYGAENQLRFLEDVGVHGERGHAAGAVAERLRNVLGNTNVDTVPREVWTRVRSALAVKHITHREFAAAMGSRFCGSTMWKHSPSRSRVARVAAILEDSELELLATNDVFWDEIAEITSLGEQPVYDATVPGTHNFVANGVHVHNSLEQDADMVILIHRPDAFERDDPRAGEADLILAKHRAGPTATVTVAHQLHYSRFADLAQA